MADRLAKEAQCGGSTPFSHQQKVASLPGRIDCSVQIFPVSFNFDIGFVHAPATTYKTFMSMKSFAQQWGKLDNPAIQSGVVDLNTALRFLRDCAGLAHKIGTGGPLSDDINGVM